MKNNQKGQNQQKVVINEVDPVSKQTFINKKVK